MTSNDEVDYVNKKLIQQILKLRQAKAEIQETFDDLDNLLHDTSIYTSDSSFSSSSHRHRSKSKKHSLRQHYDDDDVDESSSDDYALKVTYETSSNRILGLYIPF